MRPQLLAEHQGSSRGEGSARRDAEVSRKLPKAGDLEGTREAQWLLQSSLLS